MWSMYIQCTTLYMYIVQGSWVNCTELLIAIYYGSDTIDQK